MQARCPAQVKFSCGYAPVCLVSRAATENVSGNVSHDSLLGPLDTTTINTDRTASAARAVAPRRIQSASASVQYSATCAKTRFIE